MKCIKTGFYAAIPGGMFLYGDAFASGNASYNDKAIIEPRHDLILRVTSMSNEVPHRIHIRLDSWHIWFEGLRGKKVDSYAMVWQPSSTLIADANHWQWLGYQGEQP